MRESYQAKAARALALGCHPRTGFPLLNDGSKCRKCRHLVHWNGNGRENWYKCDLSPMSSSVTTDCKPSWPACQRFEERGPDDANPLSRMRVVCAVDRRLSLEPDHRRRVDVGA